VRWMTWRHNIPQALPPGASLLMMMSHLQLTYFVSTLSVAKMPYGVIELGKGLKWTTLIGAGLESDDTVGMAEVRRCRLNPAEPRVISALVS